MPNLIAASPWWRTGIAQALTSTVLLGSCGITGAVIAEHSQLSLIAVSTFRMIASGLLLVSWGVVRHGARPILCPEALRRFASNGAWFVVSGGGYFQAIALVGVGVATVASLAAATLTVTAHRCWKQSSRPVASTVLALAAALAGLILVCNVPAASARAIDVIAGAVFAASAGIAAAALSITNQRQLDGLGTAALAGGSLLAGGVLSLAFVWPSDLPLATLDLVGWGGMVFIVALQTCLGYLLYFSSLGKGVPATAVTFLSLLQPVIALTLAAWLLGERLTISAVLGSLLLVGSIILSGDVGTRPGANSRGNPSTGSSPVLAAFDGPHHPRDSCDADSPKAPLPRRGIRTQACGVRPP